MAATFGQFPAIFRFSGALSVTKEHGKIVSSIVKREEQLAGFTLQWWLAQLAR